MNSSQYTFVCEDDGILYLLPRLLELIALTSATNLLNMCLVKTARTGEVLHAAITFQPSCLEKQQLCDLNRSGVEIVHC